MMTKEEFIRRIKEFNFEPICLDNGMDLSVFIQSLNGNNKPSRIILQMDINKSFDRNRNVRKAVYRKIAKYGRQTSIHCYVGINFNSLVIIMHSKKDYNRVFDLLKYLGGKKLRKTAMNNNSFMI